MKLFKITNNKIYLRSSMNHVRLSDLVIIFVKKEVMKNRCLV